MRATDQTAWLEDVAITVAERIDNGQRLNFSIRRAREAGATLEEIAQAAGLSRQRVHQILKEEK